MSFLWFIIIGLSIGLLMSFLANEKNYVMLAFILTAIGGAILGGGLFRILFLETTSCYLAAAVGAILAVFAGIALLIYLVNKQDVSD